MALPGGGRTVSDARTLRIGAQEWLDASFSEARQGRDRVAFEAARHAAELAAKARLAEHGVPYRKEHNVAPALASRGLLPRGVDGAELSRILSAVTLGTYGYDQPLRDGDLEQAQEFAARLLQDD